MIDAPIIRDVRAPCRRVIRADTGDSAIITRPPGAIHRPAATIDWPSP
jgi:hypothetical protein